MPKTRGEAISWSARKPTRRWSLRTFTPPKACPLIRWMFDFTAPTRSGVNAFYDAALGAGGRDNGKPGVRAEYDPDYYAAFVVDPDGYRIEAYCAQRNG